MKSQQSRWIDAGGPLLGPLIRIPRPEIVEMIALAGYDFGVVDLEHGPIGHNEVYPMILAAERRGMPLLARLPGLNESYVKWLLDQGIAGLQIPHVKTADDARMAVSMSRFAPEGERGLCRFTRAAEYSNIPKEKYLSEANRQHVLVLQIEGAEGAANVEEIVKVPGVDVIFVGPYDLSQSLGLIGQIWHPKIVAEISRIVGICRSAGIKTGVFTDTPEGVAHWAALGIEYINYRVEAEAIMSSFKSIVAEAKQRLHA